MKRFVIRVMMVVCLALSTLTILPAQSPDFSFGIVADIQYADKLASGNRAYAASLNKLDACIAGWNSSPLAFTIQLGDIIDGNSSPATTMQDLQQVLYAFDKLRHRHYHVVGNHCFSVERDILLPQLSLDRGWYSFVHEGRRFIILDSMDISLQGRQPGSAKHDRALAYLEAHPKAKKYSGGLGDEQKAWLAEQLQLASRRGEKVMIFSHHPMYSPLKSESELMWDAAEIRALIDSYDCVAVAFSGHHHEGGYGVLKGIHYVTLEGMVVSPESGNAYGTVDVYEDRIEITGIGELTSRVLQFGGE